VIPLTGESLQQLQSYSMNARTMTSEFVVTLTILPH